MYQLCVGCLKVFEVLTNRSVILKDCENNISIFCLECKLFMCNPCNHKHKKLQPNHANDPIVVHINNSIKVQCETHKTCTSICGNNKTLFGI